MFLCNVIVSPFCPGTKFWREVLEWTGGRSLTTSNNLSRFSISCCAEVKPCCREIRLCKACWPESTGDLGGGQHTGCFLPSSNHAAFLEDGKPYFITGERRNSRKKLYVVNTLIIWHAGLGLCLCLPNLEVRFSMPFVFLSTMKTPTQFLKVFLYIHRLSKKSSLGLHTQTFFS